MSGLSLTLSLGGVDFCLSPTDSSPPTTTTRKQRGSREDKDAPIASVRRLASKGPSSDTVVVAELSEFSGTLRVSISASSLSSKATAGVYPVTGTRGRSSNQRSVSPPPSPPPPPPDSPPPSPSSNDELAGRSDADRTDQRRLYQEDSFVDEDGRDDEPDCGFRALSGGDGRGVPLAAAAAAAGHSDDEKEDPTRESRGGGGSENLRGLTTGGTSREIVASAPRAGWNKIGSGVAAGGLDDPSARSLSESGRDESALWGGTGGVDDASDGGGESATFFELVPSSSSDVNLSLQTVDSSESSSPTARFRKLLSRRSVESSDPPTPNYSSPIRRMDRPFRKVAAVAMMTQHQLEHRGWREDRREVGEERQISQVTFDESAMVVRGDDGVVSRTGPLLNSLSGNGRPTHLESFDDFCLRNGTDDISDGGSFAKSAPSDLAFSLERADSSSAPFTRLLGKHATEESGSSLPRPSPFYGRDRPFRKVAIAAVLAQRNHGGSGLGDRADGDGGAKISQVTFDESAIGVRGEGTSNPADGATDASVPRKHHSMTTALHRACADSDATLARLRSLLEANPGHASVPDRRGKLPIHIIAENESLLQYQRRRDDVGTFIRDLSDVYPTGIITEDSSGNTPLAPIIRHWIQGIYRAENEQQSANRSAGTESSALTRLGFARHAASRERDVAAGADGSDSDGSGGGGGERRSLNLGDVETCNRLFPEVYAPPIVEWALVMLSLALDNFGGPLSLERGTRLEQLSARGALAERVASIPHFLKTVILIDDAETRARFTELSIVRRSMLCVSSVDRWLVHMLQKSGEPSRRIVDYLVMVSELDMSDFIGKDRGPRAADFEAFHSEKRAVFEAIQSHDELLPSLLTLPVKEIERVSRTRVMWQVLDNTLSRPFVIGIIMIDFVLHLTLMIAFRITVADAGYVMNQMGDATYDPESSPVFLILSIAINQLLRKASEAAYLFFISSTVFKSYFIDFWNVVDIASISLVLASTVQLESLGVFPNSILLAFSMTLLWLRMLGLLKAMNMCLATFILSVTQIVKDIRWYLVLLAVCLFMFADTIHIVTTFSDDGTHCEVDFDEQETRVREDFCSRNLFFSYFRMYGVLVGDFEIDDYRTTPLVALLFVLFALLGMIVLLNVLIAIVSDSYEKSRIRSAYLFGRARVSFAAEHAALESFLMQPRSRLHVSDFSPRRAKDLLWMGGQVGRWAILLSLVATAVATDMFLVSSLFQQIRGHGRSYNSLVMVTFILAVLLNWAILVIFQFLFKGWSCVRSLCLLTYCERNSLGSRHSTFWTGWVYLLNLLVGLISRWVFGITHVDDDAKTDPSTDQAWAEDWDGRLDYIEKHTSRIVRESERRISERVKESEKRIREYDRAAKIELKRDIGNVFDAVKV